MESMWVKQIAFALLAVTAASAAEPVPQLRTEAVSGGSVFYVKNTGRQPLTAFLIELVDYPGSSYSLFQDETVAPGAEKKIPVTNMTVGAAPEYVKITAALYADGSTAGNPDRAALLVSRRKSALETTRELIRRLEKAQSSGTAKAAVMDDLKQWADSLQPQGKGNRMSQANVDQAAARAAVSDALGKLAQHSIEETLAGLRAVAIAK
jgi:hypothetical protein